MKWNTVNKIFLLALLFNFSCQHQGLMDCHHPLAAADPAVVQLQVGQPGLLNQWKIHPATPTFQVGFWFDVQKNSGAQSKEIEEQEHPRTLAS